jgi:hypothetical protein
LHARELVAVAEVEDAAVNEHVRANEQVVEANKAFTTRARDAVALDQLAGCDARVFDAVLDDFCRAVLEKVKQRHSARFKADRAVFVSVEAIEAADLRG